MAFCKVNTQVIEQKPGGKLSSSASVKHRAKTTRTRVRKYKMPEEESHALCALESLVGVRRAEQKVRVSSIAQPLHRRLLELVC